MLQGTHTYHLDDKGRIKLAAEVARPLGKDFTLTRGYFRDRDGRDRHGPIWVLPETHWNRLTEKLDSLSMVDHTAQILRRWFLGSADTTNVDTQGRLALPARLREHARIEPAGGVVAVGIGSRLEIWSAAMWEEYEATVNGQMIEEFARSLGL